MRPCEEPRIDRKLDRARRTRLETFKRDEPARLIRTLDALHQPFARIFSDETIDGAAAAEATARLAEALAPAPGERIWSGRQGEMTSQFLEQLAHLSSAMGPMERAPFRTSPKPSRSDMIAAPETPEHPRIAIWGPLEARLQRRDRMILASLNEGAWPKPAPADAFLNRTLRKQLGLPDPDERIGLSAHDFAQMANAPEVILLRARRIDDKPAVASRWVWRLRTLAAGGLGQRDAAEAALAPKAGADPLKWAHALRNVGNGECRSKPPRPTPPVDRRTPQPILAQSRRHADSRSLCRLRETEPRGSNACAGWARRSTRAKRGIAVHKAIEMFESPENETSLDDLIADQLRKAGASHEIIELERPLWLRPVKPICAWAEARRPEIVRAHSEKSATIPLTTAAGAAELKAKADRIELLRDGTLAIIDFKTGNPTLGQAGAVRPRAPAAARGGDSGAHGIRRHRSRADFGADLFPDLDQRRRSQGQERPSL